MDEFAHVLRLIELIDYIRLLFKGVSWESSCYQSFKNMISSFHTWLVQTILFTVSVATLYDTISFIVIIHAVLELVYRYVDALQYYRVFSPPCYGDVRDILAVVTFCTVNYVFLLALAISSVAWRFGRPATCSPAAVANRARYN